jgi:GNAT superfamily N-acetyltransferase
MPLPLSAMPGPPDNPQYICSKCGRPLTLSEAAISVVCLDHGEKRTRKPFDIRPAGPEDLKRIAKMLDYFWGEPIVDCFDTEFDCLNETNYIATVSAEPAGAICLADGGDAGIIVALGVYPEFQGLGIARALIDAAARHFKAGGQAEMRVATSNDDIPAISLYQRIGFQMYEVVPGAISRHHGKEIPGFARIPVRDEIRLRTPL